MAKTMICMLVFLGAMPFHSGRHAIRVIFQSVESRFPDAVVFSVRAVSDGGSIADAAIYYQVGWEKGQRVGLPDPFSPAPEVSLSYVWDTRGETVPPFTEVTYSWHIVDTLGNELVTPPEPVEYTDAGHDWRSLGNERVLVFWYDRPERFGTALFQAADDAYARLAEVTGLSTERAARVVIYNTQADFCSFYAPNSCQAWVGGQTFPGLTVQWGLDEDWLIHEVVPHELAHVFYNELFRDTWLRVPTWFNEGIAVYNEDTDHSVERGLVLGAGAAGDLIPLRLMGTQASGLAHGSVHLWYAEAYSLVAFLAEVYGEEALGKVILAVADNQTIEQALQRVVGLDMIGFEMAWREWLGYPVEALPTAILPGTAVVTPFTLPTAARQGGVATATAAPTASQAAAPPPATASPNRQLPIACGSTAGLSVLGLLLVRFLVPRSVRRR